MIVTWEDPENTDEGCSTLSSPGPVTLVTFKVMTVFDVELPDCSKILYGKRIINLI